MFGFTARKNRAPEPAYQIAFKITGETPSLYLSKEFKQVGKSFQNKQTKFQKKASSQLQLLNADWKPKVYLGASLALCNSCLNTAPLLTEEGQRKKPSNPRCFGQPNAVFGWCAVQVRILRNNKKNKLKYYISVIKTMIRITSEQIQNNFSIQEEKPQFQGNNLWAVRSESVWQLRQTLAYLVQCFVYL